MIQAPQEFVNEVRARFSKRLSDEIEEHGRTVMHFAEENNRLRDIVRKMAETLERVSRNYRFDFSELIREAREAIGEEKNDE